MGDIWVYISAEDPVTKAVIERLLAYCSPRLKIFKEMPARGGEIKSKIAQLNALASSKPVILFCLWIWTRTIALPYLKVNF